MVRLGPTAEVPTVQVPVVVAAESGLTLAHSREAEQLQQTEVLVLYPRAAVVVAADASRSITKMEQIIPLITLLRSAQRARVLPMEGRVLFICKGQLEKVAS